MTRAEVIDIFTKKPIEQPDDGFDTTEEYIEWFRLEGSADLAVIAEALMQVTTLPDIRAGLRALRRQIDKSKPPKDIDG